MPIFFWNTKKTTPSANNPQNRVILNGNTIQLSDTNFNLPQVTAAIFNWFKPLIFGVVNKTVVNFEVVETIDQIMFRGMWQPLKPQLLALKPEGQRAWKWFQVHAEIPLILIPDQVIYYKNEKYRVMEKLDFQEYGYVEYHIILDYQGDT